PGERGLGHDRYPDNPGRVRGRQHQAGSRRKASRTEHGLGAVPAPCPDAHEAPGEGGGRPPLIGQERDGVEGVERLHVAERHYVVTFAPNSALATPEIIQATPVAGSCSKTSWRSR